MNMRTVNGRNGSSGSLWGRWPGLAAAVIAACVMASPGRAAGMDDVLRFANDQAPENVDPYFNNVRIGVIIGQ
jgi:peptide/nickel transport system substrate-binding protein